MRYAAIDLGTNSCRLLVADVGGQGVVAVCRTLDSTRLGAGVSATARLSGESIQRTIDCMHNFQHIISSYNVRAFKVVATSAVREAVNRQELLDRAFAECGLRIEVISGKEEARLSYQGVCLGLSMTAMPLVVDLGGGSTEFVWQESELCMYSFPLGAVRAAETGMQSREMAAVLEPLKEKLPALRARPLVFVGGTATSMAAVKLALHEYRSDLVHGQKLSRAEIESVYQRLRDMSLDERRRVAGLQAKRADIIVPGIGIVLAIMDFMERGEITVSESDLLDAIVWELAR